MTSGSISNDWPQRVAILGVGLLGGSVAMSLRRKRPGVTIIGLARSEAKGRRLLDSGIIDEAADSIAEAVEGCDVVVIAAPVDRIAAMVIEAAAHSGNDCLITDVGSTKAGITEAVEADSGAAGKFIAAHPIAGSEKSGADHALATLFDGKVVVLTPGESSDPILLEKTGHFWRLCGGVTVTMQPLEHDAHLAAVSHVPHLVSALVARMAVPEARSLVGSGWEDITRVAAGDPGMWTAICQENRAAICRELGKLSDQLQQLRDILGQPDDEKLFAWLAEAKQVKDQSRQAGQQ